jgi:hypothetical protein
MKDDETINNEEDTINMSEDGELMFDKEVDFHH